MDTFVRLPMDGRTRRERRDSNKFLFGFIIPKKLGVGRPVCLGFCSVNPAQQIAAGDDEITLAQW
jgi:hypothetical protein